jgi:hypothetical protein
MRCATGLKKAPRERFALSEAEVLRRTHTPDDDRVRAAANFRLGQFLNEAGRGVAAVKYLDDAQRLRPDSWNYRRQALSLKDPTNPLAVAARSSGMPSTPWERRVLPQPPTTYRIAVSKRVTDLC